MIGYGTFAGTTIGNMSTLFSGLCPQGDLIYPFAVHGVPPVVSNL